MASSVLNSFKERAVSTAIKALDRAEELAGSGGWGQEEESSSSSPRPTASGEEEYGLAELEQTLRREMQEEVELQRKAFEARLAELESEGAGGDALAEVRAVLGEALGGAEGDPVELARSAAARLRSPETFEERELSTLRARFEAARRSHELECQQLREVANGARGVAAEKAREASAEARRAERLHTELEALRAERSTASTASATAEDGRAAAEVACAAIAAQRDNAERALHDANRRNEAMRRALRDAERSADEARTIARLADQRLSSVEGELALAKREADRAETARSNLERVARSFDTAKQADLKAATQKHRDQVAALQTELEALEERARDERERRLKAEDRVNDLETQLVKAVTEARAARAAQQASTATIRTSTVTTPPPVRTANEHSTRSTKRPGFADLLIDFVDRELES